ncbi:MAG: PQQ-dependent sugar dehydrogenase [Sedimentitalea sp.]
MGQTRSRKIWAAVILGMIPWGAQADQLTTSAGDFSITQIARGFDQPWAVGLLPGGDLLVSERGGALIHVSGARKTKLGGVPQVVTRGQGGLLDITVARDFASTREVFLTYVRPLSSGAGTALAVARLADDARSLENLRVLFQSLPGLSSGRHFGSRVVEARDGTLFVTLGDRGDRPGAQDRASHHGSVVRINRDGSVPRDNPFVGQAGVRPEIWSFGHRNVQGAALDRAGNLWTAEHGARGGDEVNRVQKGANFGWPVISYGRHYSGGKIGQGTAKPGLEQPRHYWDPSIAPSGLAVLSGDLVGDWRGDLLVGSLKFDYIARLSGSPLREVEQIKAPETRRVRDVVQGKDGAIWFVSVDRGAVYRIARD